MVSSVHRESCGVERELEPVTVSSVRERPSEETQIMWVVVGRYVLQRQENKKASKGENERREKRKKEGADTCYGVCGGRVRNLFPNS